MSTEQYRVTWLNIFTGINEKGQLLTLSEANEVAKRMNGLYPDMEHEVEKTTEMTIMEYRDTHCGGIKARFARRFDKKPQNVTDMFHHPGNWSVDIKENRHELKYIKAVYVTD